MQGKKAKKMAEWTLALIKPDAVRKGKAQVGVATVLEVESRQLSHFRPAQEIKQLISFSGFTIISEQKIQVGLSSWARWSKFVCHARVLRDSGEGLDDLPYPSPRS